MIDFIYLHKILPAIFSPIFIIIILLFLFLKIKNKLIIYLTIFITIIVSVPLSSNLIIKYIEVPKINSSKLNLNDIENIVILGGGIVKINKNYNGIESVEIKDITKLIAAVDIYNSDHNNKKIYIFKNRLPWNKNISNEGIIIKDLLVKLGISVNDIFLLGYAKNTEGEAKLLANYLSENDKIILITKNFHMKRSKLIFSEFFNDITTYPIGSFQNFGNLNIFTMIPSANSFYLSSVMIREIMGLKYYRLKYLF